MDYIIHSSTKISLLKRDLAVEFESLVTTVDELVTPEQKEEFHEFLRHTTDLLSLNVYHTKDNTFKETHKIRNNNNVVTLPGDKENSVIIMNRSGYTKRWKQVQKLTSLRTLVILI